MIIIAPLSRISLHAGETGCVGVSSRARDVATIHGAVAGGVGGVIFRAIDVIISTHGAVTVGTDLRASYKLRREPTIHTVIHVAR